MSDTNGLPTETEVVRKLDVTMRQKIPADILGEIGDLLRAVIDDFQSPIGDGTGGTGRRFVKWTGTRLYDGSGKATLLVDDIVPAAALAVSCTTLNLADVKLSEAPIGEGHDTLYRPYYPVAGQISTLYGVKRIFPTGIQNISVTATWGFADKAPWDVWEAIRCETCRRGIIAGFIEIVGAGSMISIGSFSVNTAAGVSVWKDSSPVGVFATTYEKCVAKYRSKRSPLERDEIRRMW